MVMCKCPTLLTCCIFNHLNFEVTPYHIESFRCELVSMVWMFYDVPTSSAILKAKTMSGLISFQLNQVWTYSVVGDDIYEMEKVTESG